MFTNGVVAVFRIGLPVFENIGHVCKLSIDIPLKIYSKFG